ncbi:hypothetical protein BT93_H0367 [Corymbia citriodora subsp. variegata]|nr:hypothetical protein BT93_H0367 [Corymbia citriodora subsp. variegata]
MRRRREESNQTYPDGVFSKTRETILHLTMLEAFEISAMLDDPSAPPRFRARGPPDQGGSSSVAASGGLDLRRGLWRRSLEILKELDNCISHGDPSRPRALSNL